MAETVRELVGSVILFPGDTFDAVSITVFLVSVLEAVTVESCLQQRCRIGEKDCVIDERCLAEFGEELLGNRMISRLGKLDVQQSVRCRIDCRGEQEPFVVELVHGLIDRDVIRISAVVRL
jgi:hypothetical protein